MVNLILNEYMKTFSRRRTWVFILLIVLFVLATGIMGMFMDAHDWQSAIKRDLDNQLRVLNDPGARLSEFDRQTIASRSELLRYFLEQNINPNPLNAWTFSRSILDLSALVIVFSLVIAGESIANEFNWGTIKLLLIRPVSRRKIYFAKYASVISFGVLLLSFTLLVSVVIGSILFGFSGIEESYYYVQNGSISYMPILSYLALAWLAKTLTLVVVSTIAFVISAALRSAATAIFVSVLIVSLLPTFQSLSNVPGAQFLLFTNLDFMQFIDQDPIVAQNTWQSSLGVLSVYLLVLLVFGLRMFKRHDVKV